MNQVRDRVFLYYVDSQKLYRPDRANAELSYNANIALEEYSLANQILRDMKRTNLDVEMAQLNQDLTAESARIRLMLDKALNAPDADTALRLANAAETILRQFSDRAGNLGYRIEDAGRMQQFESMLQQMEASRSELTASLRQVMNAANQEKARVTDGVSAVTWSKDQLAALRSTLKLLENTQNMPAAFELAKRVEAMQKDIASMAAFVAGLAAGQSQNLKLAESARLISTVSMDAENDFSIRVFKQLNKLVTSGAREVMTSSYQLAVALESIKSLLDQIRDLTAQRVNEAARHPESKVLGWAADLALEKVAKAEEAKKHLQTRLTALDQKENAGNFSLTRIREIANIIHQQTALVLASGGLSTLGAGVIKYNLVDPNGLKVYDLYRQILGRDPTLKELGEKVTAIQAGLLTTEALRKNLYDSEEYQLRRNFVATITQRLKNILTGFLAKTETEQIAFAGTFGIPSALLANLNLNNVNAIAAYLAGQNNHFGISAFTALGFILTTQTGITTSQETIAEEAILIDILTGTINENTRGEMVLSAYALKLTAAKHGVALYGVQTDIASIEKMGVPVIAHLDERHFAVVESVTGDKVKIREYNGDIFELFKEDFAKHWKGFVLTPVFDGTVTQLGEQALRAILGTDFGPLTDISTAIATMNSEELLHEAQNILDEMAEAIKVSGADESADILSEFMARLREAMAAMQSMNEDLLVQAEHIARLIAQLDAGAKIAGEVNDLYIQAQAAEARVANMFDRRPVETERKGVATLLVLAENRVETLLQISAELPDNPELAANLARAQADRNAIEAILDRITAIRDALAKVEADAKTAFDRTRKDLKLIESTQMMHLRATSAAQGKLFMETIAQAITRIKASSAEIAILISTNPNNKTVIQTAASINNIQTTAISIETTEAKYQTAMEKAEAESLVYLAKIEQQLALIRVAHAQANVDPLLAQVAALYSQATFLLNSLRTELENAAKLEGNHPYDGVLARNVENGNASYQQASLLVAEIDLRARILARFQQLSPMLLDRADINRDRFVTAQDVSDLMLSMAWMRDINNDSRIDLLDKAIWARLLEILPSLSPNLQTSGMDMTGDGLIDQEDIDLFHSYMRNYVDVDGSGTVDLNDRAAIQAYMTGTNLTILFGEPETVTLYRYWGDSSEQAVTIDEPRSVAYQNTVFTVMDQMTDQIIEGLDVESFPHKQSDFAIQLQGLERAVLAEENPDAVMLLAERAKRLMTEILSGRDLITINVTAAGASILQTPDGKVESIAILYSTLAEWKEYLESQQGHVDEAKEEQALASNMLLDRKGELAALLEQ
ncbi:MAG: hypothetical protein HYZ84_01955, partial [Candidatus Omnitrophica bacterium]|nr:hypothetical protein [Candidatus Omnitrophota bacterium]